MARENFSNRSRNAMQSMDCTGPCGFKTEPPSNAQLKDFPAQACRVIQDLTVLLDVSQTLQQEHDLRRTMAPVLERMARHLGMNRSFITIYDREREELRIDQAQGLSEDVIATIRYKPGEGVMGRVMATGQKQVIRDIHDCPDFLNKTDTLWSLEHPANHTMAFLSVPISGTEGFLGTINVFRPIHRDAPDTVLDPDVRLLTLIAAQIAQAVRLRQVAHEHAVPHRKLGRR